MLCRQRRGKSLRFGCYTFPVVEYVKLGRKLGIGTRVAAKILRQRTQNATSAAGAMPSVEKNRPASPQQRTSAKQPPANRESGTRVATRNLTRGVARGSRGFWKPFARVVHALWHEVTGVFFAIFALFFIQNTWRLRGSWRSGAEHGHFIVYLVLAVLFVYFSVTAFVTSRRHKQ